MSENNNINEITNEFLKYKNICKQTLNNNTIHDQNEPEKDLIITDNHEINDK
mgnify:CR=1 FL=1